MKAKPSRNTLDLKDIEQAGPRSSKWLAVLRPAVVKVAGHKKVIFTALAVIIIGLGSYLWYNYKPQAKTGEAELMTIKTKVSRHYLLPNNEVPALATVTDTSKLTTPFFKGTKDGDQILIYQKNRMAIIYRPSLDRIVSVGPVTIDTPHIGSGQTTQ